MKSKQTTLSFNETELNWLHMALVFAKREIKSQLDALPNDASGVSINIFTNLHKALPKMIGDIESKIDKLNEE